MRILNSCVAGLPIYLFLEIKKPEKSGFFWLIFSQIGLALAKHCLSCIFMTRLLRRGSITTQDAQIIAKNYCCPKKMTDVIDKKQMHDSVITENEYASKDWTCVISMFLTSFNVYFVCGCACFMCLCFKTTISLFWDKVWLFLVKTGWQPCCVV